tara:strand:- start:412 stop:1170 length:759 start_codon:yes stop_codon:yes gene_type:complete
MIEGLMKQVTDSLMTVPENIEDVIWDRTIQNVVNIDRAGKLERSAIGEIVYTVCRLALMEDGEDRLEHWYNESRDAMDDAQRSTFERKAHQLTRYAVQFREDEVVLGGDQKRSFLQEMAHQLSKGRYSSAGEFERAPASGKGQSPVWPKAEPLKRLGRMLEDHHGEYFGHVNKMDKEMLQHVDTLKSMGITLTKKGVPVDENIADWRDAQNRAQGQLTSVNALLAYCFTERMEFERYDGLDHSTETKSESEE